MHIRTCMNSIFLQTVSTKSTISLQTISICMYVGMYVCIITQVNKIKLHYKVQAKVRKLNSSQAGGNATAPEFMHEQNWNEYKIPYSFIMKDVLFLILSFLGWKCLFLVVIEMSYVLLHWQC